MWSYNICCITTGIYRVIYSLFTHGYWAAGVFIKTSLSGGTTAAAPPPFRPSDPALCGSRPLVTPCYCRLGDLQCLFVHLLFVYYFVCVSTCVFCVFFLFWGCFPLYLSPSVLWYCWLGLLTSKIRLPYNLYCVAADISHAQSINQSINQLSKWYIVIECVTVETKTDFNVSLLVLFVTIVSFVF